MGFLETLKNLAFDDAGSSGSKIIVRTKRKDEPVGESLGLYSDMLGLNREYSFGLVKNKVENDTEWEEVVKCAEALLAEDLKRFGIEFNSIPEAFRNSLRGEIGSMTIIAGHTGATSVKFHRRDKNGIWDGTTRRFPEKDTKAKYKHEVFFLLETEDDD